MLWAANIVGLSALYAVFYVAGAKRLLMDSRRYFKGATKPS